MNHPFFGILLSIIAFNIGLKVQKKFRIQLLNPLLLASILIISILTVAKIPYSNFKIGGDMIALLIGPATVSLAIPLYENIESLKKHWKVIALSIVSGTLAHAVCIGLFAFAFKLNPEMIATFVPKSVTTAIAVDISSSLGGISTLTLCIVVLTGIIGATLAPILIKAFKLTSPIAQGIALGVSSHAVGTSKAIELGPIQGTLSSLSLVLTGLLTVLLSPLTYKIIITLIS